MALREIITHPNPVLRRKARKVSEFGPELQTLIDDMVETMRDAPGVGLAAPQIGVSQRVIVVEYGEEDNPDAPRKLYALVNPQIVKVSDEKVPAAEGCLSLPMLAGNVERATEVTVKALNRRGQPVKIKAKDWLARIFQHEIDHLEGVLFIDLTDEVWQMEETPVEAAEAD